MIEPSVEVQRGAKDQPVACSVGPAELALLDSPSGPFATRVLTVRPTFPQLAVDSAPFRVLQYCSASSDFPAAGPARCRCQRSLEVLGDHVAVCHRCGTLRQRRGPLESGLVVPPPVGWRCPPAAPKHKHLEGPVSSENPAWIHCTIYTMYYVRCIMYYVPCSMYNELCTMYYLPCTVYCILCTMYYDSHVLPVLCSHFQ